MSHLAHRQLARPQNWRLFASYITTASGQNSFYSAAWFQPFYARSQTLTTLERPTLMSKSTLRSAAVRTLTAMDQDVRRSAQVNVTGLAGFLMAKIAAARSRRKPKDWYDIAFVLLHNDYGDVNEAANHVKQVFGSQVSSLSSAITDLRANFDGPGAQGTTAYVTQITQDHPALDPATIAADCQLAIQTFCDILLG